MDTMFGISVLQQGNRLGNYRKTQENEKFKPKFDELTKKNKEGFWKENREPSHTINPNENKHDAKNEEKSASKLGPRPISMRDLVKPKEWNGDPLTFQTWYERIFSFLISDDQQRMVDLKTML